MKSIGGDCGQLHLVASDSRLDDKNHHVLLEKSVTLQNSHPRSNEMNTGSILVPFTLEGDEKNSTLVPTTSSYPYEQDEVDNEKDKKQKENQNVTILAPRSTDEENVVRSIHDNSDSGSIISLASSSTDISSINNARTEDGDGSSVKSKKRRSFFNFRRSKKDHKKEVIL